MGIMRARKKARPPIKWLRTACRWRERRRRWGEWGIKLPMLASILIWASVTGLVVTSAYLVIYHWVLEPTNDLISNSTVLSMSLTIAAGTGGLVLLVVNYRKQHDLEESRFVERFGTASLQLGNDDAAVRLAGVYALTGVAERTRHRGQIQQCIDVLCGYLRLPYEPNKVGTHQTLEIVKYPDSDTADLEREKHYKYRQNDVSVRQAIVKVIAVHLQKNSRSRWSTFDFDFTGVRFVSADFEGAVFSGKQVSFERAIFEGEKTWFKEVTFNGERTSFNGATFGGDMTWFEGATFRGERTWFDEATFAAEQTWFEGATFSGERTSFDEVRFSGRWAWFKGVTFSGMEIDFCDPRQWDSVMFDWDDANSGISKPPNVKPDEWPPKVKPAQNPQGP